MNTQDQNLPSDFLETLSPANPSTPDVAEDSPTSNYDAGLDDKLSDEAEIGGNGDQPLSGEMEAYDEDDMTGKGRDEYSRREIPITDLTDASREDFIHSPELADMNVPGEIDIEDLDEDAVTEDLPADARLDPLED